MFSVKSILLYNSGDWVAQERSKTLKKWNFTPSS